MNSSDVDDLIRHMDAALEKSHSMELETRQMLDALKDDRTLARYQSLVTQRMRETEAREGFFTLRNRLFEALRPPNIGNNH